MNKVSKILKSRWYPLAPQLIMVLVFSFILLDLLFGADDAAANPGTVVTWLLWWPIIPLTFILVGRAWCAICPFGALGDWVRARFGLNRPTPRWLKKYGIWVINGLFFLVTWYEIAFGLTKSVSATGAVLATVLIAAVGLSLIFERRAWCRHLCFLGGIFGNYAQTAAIELNGEKDICKHCTEQSCFNGNEKAPGCSLSISPKTITSNRTCNFCGDCLKSCNNDSPKIVIRHLPGSELWQKARPRFDESFLAVSLVGIIFISTLGMLEIWQPLIDLAGAGGRVREVFVVTLYILGLVGAGLAIYTLAAFVSAKFAVESFKSNFSRFGYGLIPLNLAIHVAHNLNHFLGEGKLILKSLPAMFIPSASAAQTAAAGGSEAGSMSGMSHGATNAFVSAPSIQALQFGIVGAGILLSFYVVKRIVAAGENDEAVGWPHYLTIILFGFISFWLFSLPMSARH